MRWGASGRTLARRGPVRDALAGCDRVVGATRVHLVAREGSQRRGAAICGGLPSSMRTTTFLPRLESLCADYVVQAMTRLGWQPQVGDKVDARALAQRLRIAPRHHRLFGRLLAILAEAGHLAGDAQALTVQRALPSVDPATQLERLGAEFPGGAGRARNSPAAWPPNSPKRCAASAIRWSCSSPAARSTRRSACTATHPRRSSTTA